MYMDHVQSETKALVCQFQHAMAGFFIVARFLHSKERQFNVTHVCREANSNTDQVLKCSVSCNVCMVSRTTYILHL